MDFGIVRWRTLLLTLCQTAHDVGALVRLSMQSGTLVYVRLASLQSATSATSSRHSSDHVPRSKQTFKRLKGDLIAVIPRRPNNKDSLQALESQAPTDLIIIYLCWRLRHVQARPRTIKGHSRLWFHPSYLRMRENVARFLQMVNEGRDLTPYLSLKAQTDGFVLDGSALSEDWEHKDFLLNVMGLHHFHLGTRLEPKGHIARTNHVLFAFVAPDTFDILGLYDHRVFEADGTTLTRPRKRIWARYDRYQRGGTPPGGAYLGGYGGLGITTAGPPTVVTLAAMDHIGIIKRFDPCLQSREFHAWLWDGAQVPLRPKLRWHYRHLTLGLLDASSNNFFALTPSP